MNHSLQVQSGPRRLLTTMQALLLLLFWLLAAPAHAITTSTSYTLPAALTSSPFNCTMATATIYDCSGSISLDKDAELILTSDLTLRVGGSFSSAKNLATTNQGHTFQLTVGGNVSMQKDTDIDMSITAGGNISFAKNARVDGNLQAGGSLTLAKDSTINGNVTVGGNLTGAKNDIINGTCTVTGTTSSVKCSSAAALHHVRATTTGTGTTCGGTSITITACNSADSNGSCTAYTGGISGTLSADAVDDSDLGSVAFNIPSGSSSTTVTLPTIATAQTASLSFDNVSKTTSTQGTCWDGTSASCDLVISTCGADHVRLSHAGTGVTCVPSTVTVYACSDADTNGSCTASTTGISGTVTATGSGGSLVASTAFTIPSGSSSVAVSVPVTTAQTVTFGTSGLSPAPGGSPQTTCWNGTSSSCSYTYADSGFIFDVPNHVAGNVQTVTVQAVRKADNSTACTPTLGAGTYALNFSCNYTDPAGGTQNVTVTNPPYNDSTAALACNGSASPVSLIFSSLSKTTINVSYPDAGKVTLNASYTGSGVTIAGNDTFVAAPSKFVIGTTTTPLQADVAYNATVTAVNKNGGTMPNFGQDSGAYRAKLTFGKCGGTSTGTFGGTLSSAGVVNMPAFVNGVSTSTTGLKYSEVGTLDATASMTDSSYAAATAYLGYTTSPTGTTNTASTGCSGSFGTFQPAYFTTVPLPTAAANTTRFAYSGVPFTVRVTAMNGSGNTVKNYSTGGYAKDVTLSAVTSSGTAVAGTVGTLSNTSAPATSFASGVADDTTTTFTFPAVTGGVNGTKLAPQKIYLRATDANSTPATSALNGTNPSPYETSIEVRYGRLRLFNAYGASLSSLNVPLQAQYWNGSVWVVNGDDSSTIKANAFGLTGYGITAALQSNDVTFDKGKATVTVTSGSKSKGYADIAVNLDSTGGTMKSCLSGGNPSGTTAANLLGLRSYQGSYCASDAYIYDPSARAYFGTQSQETKGVVHIREVFN